MLSDLLQLETGLDELLYEFGFQLVDLQMAGVGRGRLFRVFIDRVDAAPVTIDDCGAMASQVKLYLEMKGVYNDTSSLELSSAGVDRVLKHNRDFERFLGSEVRVRFHEGPQRQTVTGELTSFTDDVLVLTLSQPPDAGQTKVVPRPSVERVNLVPHLEI